MLTEERHEVIRGLLAADGRVLAAELAARFGVSEDTVRRDLRDLAKAGQLRRVHGGALAPAPRVGPIAERIESNSEVKARLAVTAAGLVQPGQTIFIDAGSTNLAIAAALPEADLTVITNAPAIAMALATRGWTKVIVLGGRFNPLTGSTSGAGTVREIEALYADLYFLGACAVEASFGVSALDADEAEVKRAMASQSRAVVVAATRNKLGTAAPFRVTTPDRLTHLVAEADVDRKLLSRLASNGTTIHRA
ncbi:MAG TPA: DeoR/GlpR family DNA-binding transcription regulator [Devosia sp.]